MLVFTHKLVDYQYFMYDLQDWELNLISENIGWTYKNEWEMTRIQSYCALSAFGKPKKRCEELFPLITDKDTTYEHKNTTFSDDDKAKIEEKMKYIEQFINGSTDRNQNNE